MISRNNGLINYGELAELIRFFYLKQYLKKENKNMLIIIMIKHLSECFNALTEYNEKYINQKYSYKQLFIIVYMFFVYRDKDKNEMCEIIDRLVDQQDKLDDKKFASRIPRRSMVNELEKLLKEGEKIDV